ncbi:RDD family protein [Candidatus Mesenet endosymbiont of Agriotes lineatus]|uniref:RDD family protein n=1 Tax=Candidatus Mesenet endosymbiont of Agriotes lineatus TaxID=3077948 RepID=UPI0030D48732
MSNIYLEPAGLIRRFIAFCVDYVITMGLSLIIFPFIGTGLVYYMSHNSAAIEQIFEFAEYIGTLGTDMLSFLISLLPLFLYYACFRQTTLGQRLMGIYVVRLDQTKIRISFVLKRALILIFLLPIVGAMFGLMCTYFFDELTTIEILSLVFFIVLYIMPPVISNKNQMIHDMLLKTVVVKGRLKRAN